MPKCCSLGDMAPVPCAIQSYPTNRLANCHREIWGGSWPRRKLWPGQLPPHLCQRDFPRFTAARVSLQSVCQDAQDHRGSDREWLKSRCPGLPRQRETGCRKLATAGCDRLSQAQGRWLRRASRPPPKQTPLHSAAPQYVLRRALTRRSERAEVNKASADLDSCGLS